MVLNTLFSCPYYDTTVKNTMKLKINVNIPELCRIFLGMYVYESRK